MSIIRDRICRAIEVSGKSRYRLSQETGIAQSQLSRLLSEGRGVSLDNLEQLADALGLEVEIRPKKAAKTGKRR